jgi:NADPH:quinone reductase-like Zn-dependent oxidoreductase
MKTWRIAAYAGPAGLELCTEPDPPAPRGRQVVVRVRASSLNFREWLDVHGLLAKFAPLPERRIPGSDAAGDVVAIGEDVRRVQPGARVATVFYSGWLQGPMPADMNIIGRSARENDGTLTEYMVVDEAELVQLPPHLSYEEAATLPCAAVTAWTSLFTNGHLTPGDAVLIEGSGGVALFALQFARIAGARAIVTTTSPSKREQLMRLGAHAVIDANDTDWPLRVRAANASRGVDLTLSTAGGPTVDGCIAATRPGGTVFLVGMRDDRARTRPALLFGLHGVSAFPTRVGNRDHFDAMNRAIDVSQLRPVIAQVFEFGAAPAAFEFFGQGGHFGKVVIRHA